MQIEYKTTHEIRATLELVTGLHIGAGRDAVEIGGVDSPVIKHPHSQQPYIPGSSLKGKLRTILEWTLHKIHDDGKPWGTSRQAAIDPRDEVLRIFGATADKWDAGPTRLVVRDAHLLPEWVNHVMARGLNFTEDKTEVSINRIEGKAQDGGLRTMERVPAGAKFQLEILFREFDVDTDGGERDRECLNRVLEALKLLEKDCLGGSGSRGYGQVRIAGLTVNGQDRQQHFDAISAVSREQAQNIAF